MEQERDIIQGRLNQIEDLEDRKLLKRVLYDVFWNIKKYDLEMYETLEKRIYGEIDDPLDKYYIYTTILDKDAVDPISSFFHTMLVEEGNAANALDTIFMQCDALRCQDIWKEGKQYPCIVKTDKKEYSIFVTLCQCTKYIAAIEKLYRVFRLNGIPWSTIHCPYAYHFADVCPCQPLLLSDEEHILEIAVDWGEETPYMLFNVIPVWNVKPITLQDKSFPMPARNKIHYEHLLSHGEGEFENGYLITEDNMEFTYMKRYEKDLSIISPYPDQQAWNLIRIENNQNLQGGRYPFEITDNARRLGFAGRYASKKSFIVRTKAEIDRVLSCYGLSEQLHLIGMRILESYEGREQTFPCNDFVEDNIREDENKKVLLLRFLAEEKEDFLIYDKMSFFTSEIQILFPEMRCIGELV